MAGTQEGRLNVVLLEGRSGIGKTALIKHFLGTSLEKLPNLLSLSGRCYEFESVPYKGFDSLIDLLSALFPVLGRIKPIATAPIRVAVPDDQELRQRTFAALRELRTFLSLVIGLSGVGVI